MYFEPQTIPDNKELKEYLGWRATCVTEAQTKNLLNKLDHVLYPEKQGRKGIPAPVHE